MIRLFLYYYNQSVNFFFNDNKGMMNRTLVTNNTDPMITKVTVGINPAKMVMIKDTPIIIPPNKEDAEAAFFSSNNCMAASVNTV